ncbi:MAG: hypothetical protein ABSD53_09090 [Terriglobales bacterium]
MRSGAHGCKNCLWRRRTKLLFNSDVEADKQRPKNSRLNNVKSPLARLRRLGGQRTRSLKLGRPAGGRNIVERHPTEVRDVPRRARNQEMRPFRWEDIDHRLVVLKLVDLSEEMSNRIKADERRIRFENRLNLNSNTVPSLILQMKVESAEEKARREYEIYCSVWQIQGYVKSADFVRAVCAHIVQMLGVRAKSIANEFSRSVRGTNLPFSLRTAHLNKLELRMRQLQSRWHRRLEIDAKECEHAERRATLAQQNIQQRNGPTKELPVGAASETTDPTLRGENRQETPGSNHGRSIKKPGRPPRLGRSFVEYAGALRQEAISDSHRNVPIDKLRQIASALDAGNYLPPSEYLEGKYARELKEFNSRNSNSTIGPIKTWSKLVSLGDKDILYGMRRLLSRCAQKLDDLSLSGN